MRWLPFFLCASLGAAELLIEPEALARQLADPKLVLLHVGSPDDYAPGHLPGAIFVRMNDLGEERDGLRLQMPATEKLREKLLSWGIGNDSRIVVYAGNDSVQSATRVWFTLDYLSLPVSMLNGGLSRWKTLGLPTTTEAPKPQAAAALDLKPQPQSIVDYTWVNAHRADSRITLVDARLPEFYSGQNAGNMPRSGHIPGARNVPFPSLLAADRRFLTPEEMRDKLGTKPVAAYCHIGMQATVAIFAARLAGLEARLYDGSFEEWSRQMDLPVEAQQ